VFKTGEDRLGAGGEGGSIFFYRVLIMLTPSGTSDGSY